MVSCGMANWALQGREKMRAHVQLIAYIHITAGVITAIAGTMWTFFWRLMPDWVHTADFSYQTSRPGHGSEASLSPVFQILSMGAIAAVFLVGVPSIISGVCLLKNSKGARFLGIVASALNLLTFFNPVSLVGAIYGLVILPRYDTAVAMSEKLA